MHPVLVDFGFFTIGTYGFALVLAFLSGIALAVHRARREDVPPGQILDLSVWLLVASIVGAKLLLLIVDWRLYADRPELLPGLLRLGGVYYGGLILAVVTGLWYVRRKGLNTWKVADILAPSIALGQAIGRIGCFMAGCCYGTACSHPWAVTFTDPAAHDNVGVPLHVPLHPTQLYSSLNALLIFGLLMLVARRKRFDGQVFWTYAGVYSVTRSLIEFFRGDYRGTLFGGAVSTSQFVSLFFLAAAIASYALLRNRSRR
jgi:phosphatidylglycerol:prolipoprotein diacylglycerol transferase